MTNLFKKNVFRLQYKLIAFLQILVKPLVIWNFTRTILNGFYLQLNTQQTSCFYQWFSKIYRDTHFRVNEGIWKVNFGEQTIFMPLTSDSLWLDWDQAISIVGHDIDVKQTYEAILTSELSKPDLFVDIGANYGTHSLLFLIKGIKTITFEPNHLCYFYYKNLCKYNDVAPTLEKVALGEENGYVDLAYPKKDTWNGSINIDIIQGLVNESPDSKDIIVEKVIQKRLDDYLSRIIGNKVLIKIDTEGYELSVLKGSTKTLQEVKPMIIFECIHTSNSRSKLSDFFSYQNYLIYKSPWNPVEPGEPLTSDKFSQDLSTNFIAVSREQSLLLAKASGNDLL